MRALALIVVVCALAGCAATSQTLNDAGLAIPPVLTGGPSVSFGQGYNEGLSGEHARALRIVNRYAYAFDDDGCNVATSYLPKHNRSLDQYAKARAAEQRLKLRCARKYRAAVDAYYAMRQRLRYE